ncbi:tyrosine-type recombinase/integrase [Peribacillus sp. SCS-155]|uniref:tyrosine-type recombinase/integrase n=1 Tax=Peribacillus sedimenti TaxID=3115297 RepID=UPI003905E2C4
MAGSIEKRGNNSYRLIVSLGYGPDGKRIKKTKTVKANGKREAEKLLAQFVTEVEAGEYIAPEKMLFSRFVEEWESKYAKKNLSPSTLTTYKHHLKNHILPYFGHKNLDKISPMSVITFLNDLSEPGRRKDGKEASLSTATVEYNHRILKNIFQRATEWKVIKVSPLQDIKKPKVHQRETGVYNQEEAKLLLARLKSESLMWQVFIHLAITTGMRRGELIGLEWDHVDFIGNTIHIKQSLTYVNGEYIIKEPKTKNSKRTVAIPENVMDMLKIYYEKWRANKEGCANVWAEGNHCFLFTAFNGKPLHPSSVKNWWNRFIRKNELKYIRFHDLRHTSASLLINKGVHMKVISNRLGHADIRTTMNIYGHVLQDAEKAAANQFDDIFDSETK